MDKLDYLQEIIKKYYELDCNLDDNSRLAYIAEARRHFVVIAFDLYNVKFGKLAKYLNRHYSTIHYLYQSAQMFPSFDVFHSENVEILNLINREVQSDV